jgi:urea transport system substrate-binding protein
MAAPPSLPAGPPSFAEGTILAGKYRVERIIGRGGMGLVVAARHIDLDERVALKFLLPEQVTRTDAVRRFLREARLTFRLKSEHVARVSDTGRLPSGEPYIVMELLSGIDLGKHLAAHGPLPVDEAIDVVLQAADAVAEAHALGIIHRDLKPANLFLTQHPSGLPFIKVLDFGISKLVESGTFDVLTRGSAPVGSVLYMSPEQMTSPREVDHRADIYALGVTLFELLTGRAPFEGDTWMSLCGAVMAGKTLRLEALRPDAPAGLGDVVALAMARAPEARFPSVGSFALALAPFASERSRTLVAHLVETWGTAPPRPPCPSMVESDPSPTSGQSPVPPSVPHSIRLVLGDTIAAPSAVTLPHTPPPPAEPPPRLDRRRALLLGALALGGAGLAGAGLWSFLRGSAGASATNAVGVGASRPSIKVGVLHSLSGTMAISERPVVDATLLALDEIAEAGGLLGREVEPVVVDSRSEPEIFAREAERLLVEEKVAVVFGGWTSAARKAARPVFERLDHLLVYPVQYEGLEDSKNIIYMGPTQNQQALPALRWCAETLGARRFFLLGSDYVFPRAVNAILGGEIQKLGGSVLGERYVLLGETDFSAVVQAIVATRPDLVINTLNGDSNVPFFRALRAAGITPRAVPTLSLSIGQAELLHMDGLDMAGDLLAWSYFQSIPGPENEAFVQRFRARYGERRALTDPMEAAYAGVRLWAEAVRATGTERVKEVRHAMLGRTLRAPEGEVRIDPGNNNAWKLFRMGRVVEGCAVQIVHTSPAPIDPQPFPESRTRAEWEAFLDDLARSWGGRFANPEKPNLLRGR